MHPNPAFVWDDAAAMRAFAAARGFAHLCVAGPDAPIVAHAPLVVTADGNVRVHVARTNRIVPWLDGAAALASIADHDFYVSPDWYASADQVPTWNYLAVEIEGQARMLDEAALIEQVDTLSAAFEAPLAPKPAWTRAKMAPGRFEAMLRAIVGFELTGTTWRGTRKLGQNKPHADRAAMADALSAAGLRREAELVMRA